MPSRQYATFEVADQLFGVEVSAVQEVRPVAEYTAVPLAPAAVAGLFNLRGQIIVAVDLRVQLGLARRTLDAAVVNVILHGDDEAVGLLVDRIGQVVEVDDELVEPTPDIVGGRDLAVGMFALDGRQVLVLNVPAAIDVHQLVREHGNG